jgi:hypothetical protein
MVVVRRIPREDRQVMTIMDPGEPVMLYAGIDQHRKQLTVNLRDESGSIIFRRQVSTEWKKVRAFFDEVRVQRSPTTATCPSWKSAASTTGC